MKSLAALLIFAGYTLIYAATANQGKFATEPWAGLFADAYVTPASPTSIPGVTPIPAPHGGAAHNPAVTGIG